MTVTNEELMRDAKTFSELKCERKLAGLEILFKKA